MEIFYSKISKSNHSYLLDTYLDKFGDKYKVRMTKYRRWQDAQLSLLGRVLLLKYVEELQISETRIRDLCYDSYGKPYLDCDSFFFNISHSQEIVICAISKSFDLGIDIEYMKEIDITCFKNQMPQAEWHRIDSSRDKMLEFYTYWTEKEAVVKADGKGFTIPLESFEIENNQAIINGNNFFISSINIDKNYCCSLAVKSEFNNIDNVTIKEVFI